MNTTKQMIENQLPTDDFLCDLQDIVDSLNRMEDCFGAEAEIDDITLTIERVISKIKGYYTD